ncbi:MAG: D-alanine--D-alanine ligase [Hyphomicrobiaceae bacterium]
MSQRKFNHVAVLMGGLSAEREVSLRSGAACAEALEKAGYRVSRIDVGRDAGERLAALKPDVCFNALHGRWGEDGCVQGLLECLAIPYTHSGVLASSLAMDKALAKRVLRAAGVPVAEDAIVSRDAAAASHALEPPYVAKPIAEGSSVGVVIVPRGAEIPSDKISKIPAPNGLIMVERYVAGRELTCGVIGDRVTGIIDIVPNDNLQFYDYEAKYAPGGSRHILPADLPCDVYRAVQAHTLAAHRALGCRGVSRADFRYDDTAGGSGEIVCLEVNTQPGMTGTSLVPELAQHAGISFVELVTWIVEDASVDR